MLLYVFMKHLLPTPDTLGMVDPALLSRVHKNAEPTRSNSAFAHATIDADSKVTRSNGSKLFNALLKAMAPLILEREEALSQNPLLHVSAHRRILQPNDFMIAYKWHVDSRRYAVSKGIPTEFLHGVIDTSIAPLTGLNIQPIVNSSYFKPQEPEHVYTVDDGTLVGFDERHFHRSARNGTERPIDRLFIVAIAVNDR